jgi:hypothetical protein
MKIIKNINDKSSIINDFEEWKEHCRERMLSREKDSEKKREAEKEFNNQWIDNKKSSPMMAKYWLKKDREIVFQNILTKLIDEEVIFEAGIPEYAASFDKFSGPRYHDFFIFTLNYNTIISVEGKSGESWINYNTFLKEYSYAKNIKNKWSKKLPRCENLIKNYFLGRVNDINNIIYQILTWFAGSLADAIKFKSKNIIMLHQQFDIYNKVTNENNIEFNKFIRFISKKDLPGDILDYKIDKGRICLSEPIINEYTKGKNLYIMHLVLNQSNGT